VSGGKTVPSSLDGSARTILAEHWRPEGYTVPNSTVYPFQWLWDSCFHAIVWAHLGEGDRALTELAHVFRTQDDSGFVPHIDYEADPTFHAEFWRRDGASTITQPPMYGHAVAQLRRFGIDVPAEVVACALAGLYFLLEERERDARTGLITIVHPWESGADDSPRWDHWCDEDSFDERKWYDVKGRLMDTIVRGVSGAPLCNPAFGAAPIGFNALVAFNARELADASGDSTLEDHAAELFLRLGDRWDDRRRTWVDAGPAEATSGAVRTLDGLLVTLGVPSPIVFGDLVDDRHYGGRFGPAGVHRDEESFASRTYWRGPAWPQLTYLLWVAAGRASDTDAQSWLASRLVSGARSATFAEYWDPDDGTSLGARPQSWTTLAAVCAASAPGATNRRGRTDDS